MKHTIWYEITDPKYAKILRKIADDVERTGFARLFLENVELPADGSTNVPARRLIDRDLWR